jgi:D-alanine-D-alanine ligase-like ATP-grasp enzyme
MVSITVEYARSAFKHGVNEADIWNAILTPLYNDVLDEYENKYLLLGFDCAMNVLEIIYNYLNESTIRVFHAMKCRTAFLALFN